MYRQIVIFFSLVLASVYIISCCVLLAGLSVTEAAKLCSFLHFREPEKLLQKTLLQRANMDKALDFLDPIDEDIPKGRSLCENTNT